MRRACRKDVAVCNWFDARWRYFGDDTPVSELSRVSEAGCAPG